MLKCKYCTVPISRDTAIMRKHLLNCQSCPDNIKMALQKASQKENQLKRSISNNDNDGNQEEESNENLNRNKKIKIEENKVDEPVCTNDANSKEKISENDIKLEAETSKNEIKSDDIKTENSDDSNDLKSENANKSDDTKSKNSKKSDNLKSENVRSESTKIVSQADHDSKKKPQKVSEECFISANGKVKVIPAKIKSQTKERILSFLDDPRYQIPQLIEENMEKDFREKIQGNFLQDLEKSLKRPSKLLKNDMIDSQILDDFHEKQNKLKQSRESEQFRSNYLVNRKKNDILNKISEHQVVLISGEPDCGMSTQIAQYILDQEIIRERGSLTSISSVHLRTLSTSTIAEKVASERGEDIGCSVGVFTHSKTIFPRPQGSISFCTTGLLLELIRVDPVLKRFSHIVINDIHERNIESDLILALLKRIIFKRPTLKVILLCTSPYYEDFSKYFNDCCTLELPKKNVTVDEFYLEDVLKFTRFRNFPTAWNRLSNKELSTAVKSNKQYRQFEIEFEEMIRSYTQKLPPKSYPPFVLQELTKFTSEKISFELIVNLVRYISGTKGPGSILIFVPEIMDVIKLHETLGSFFTPEFFKIFSLHSKITNRELNNIFYNTPEGIRKIIIATDIAQTSVTMQDIRYVINCGMKKQYKYNVEQDLETMETEWISRTEAQWRKQHAGRNRPGLCYHLYSKARAETFEQFPKPDILRFQLKKLVLQMKILKIEDLENFSSSFLTTPDPINLNASIAALKEMNALDEHSNLTPLGYHLAFLPLDPVTGKMILLAAMFACIEPVFTIAAKISIKDIFYSDTNEEEILFKKQRLECSHLSDHIFISEALRRFELQSSSLNASIFCEEYSLSFKALDMMSITKKEFSQYLFDMGFLKNKNPSDSYANLNSDNFSLIRAIVCAAFYPNIGIICQSSKKIGRTIVKSASKSKSVKAAGVNVTSVIQGVSYFPIPYLTFNEKKDWINPFGEITTILFDTTVISPLAIFLASTAVDYEKVPGNSVISVSQCLYFVCELETSFIVQKLQEQLALLLKCKITDPEANNWDLLRENLTRAIAVYLSDNNKVTGKVESGFGTCHSLHKIDDKWNRTGNNSRQEDAGGEMSQRGERHPPWLKGKAIGLFYANKNREKNKGKNKDKAKNSKRMPIKLRPSTELKIRNLIDTPHSSRAKFVNSKEMNDDDDFEAKYNDIADSQFKRKFLRIISGNLSDNLDKSLMTSAKMQRNESIDLQFLDELNQKKRTSHYNEMLRFRKKLPAFEKKEEILDLIYHNQVVLISGETGCGKTTQVAQFILDDEIENKRGSITKIACTQPRRISAITVAERVAAERADRLGNSVGFHIRLEKNEARQRGSIVFCTTGMLLQFMQMDPGLRSYSHIIIDEIHERSIESDFIITLLKQIIPKRPDLKVILMSATLNSEQFSKYYNNCPMIEIPGFTYPVEELYLEDVLAVTRFRFPVNPQNQRRQSKKNKNKKQQEFSDFIGPYIRHLDYAKKYPDYVLNELQNPESEKVNFDLMLELTKYICLTKGPGAILIFLPGVMDISKLHRMLLDSGSFPSHRYKIFALHSRMPTADQKNVFNVPSKEIRKIIIATNIAETSITIEDVVYVIDSGKTKLKRFDVAENLQTLEPEWVSVANARQRKGRAGRVQPGVCYHLFTKVRLNTFDQYPLPEMLRTRLEEVILKIKILQIGKAETFLAGVMDPPDPKVINLSLELLKQLNAIDEGENLTPLGYHLAHLPLDPRSGKMILWAAMFSCVEPVFAIAASLSFKDAFYCPLGKEDVARKKKLELGLGQYSDHVALAEALRLFEEHYRRGNAYSFCHEYFLSWNTLKLLTDMKQQFARYLYEMRFLDSVDPSDRLANRNSHNLSLIKGIVCAGLYPNVAIVKKSHARNGVSAITIEKEKVKVHPSSINEKVDKFPSPYLTYYLKMKSTGIYLFDTTCVSPLALLFASPSSSLAHQNGEIDVANNVSFLCEPKTAGIIQKLHRELDALLEHKVAHPGTIDFQRDTREGKILSAIIELLSESDEILGLDSGRYHAWGDDDFDEDCVEFDDYE